MVSWIWRYSRNAGLAMRRLKSGTNTRTGEPLKPTTLRYYENQMKDQLASAKRAAEDFRKRRRELRATKQYQMELRARYLTDMENQEHQAGVIQFPLSRRLAEIAAASN
jgi:hypothetical protein